MTRIQEKKSFRRNYSKSINDNVDRRYLTTKEVLMLEAT
jgi:hypothetical protein